MVMIAKEKDVTTDAIAGRSVRDGNKITTPIYMDGLLIGCHVWDHYAQGISHFEPMSVRAVYADGSDR